MSNEFYEHDDPFAAGTLIASAAVNSQLDLVETGFEAVETDLTKRIKLPDTFTGNNVIPDQTFENRVVYVNSNGDADLYSMTQFEASIADATTQAGIATAQANIATAAAGTATAAAGTASTAATNAGGSASYAYSSELAAAASAAAAAASAASGVTSVNTNTGPNVVLDTDAIADTAANRYTSDTDKTRLANTSGTNTGDNAGYSTVKQAGSSPVAQEDTLEFAGSGVSVAAGSGKTTVTVSGTGNSTAGYIDRVLAPNEPIFLCGVGQSLMTPYVAQLSSITSAYPTIDSPTPLPNIQPTPAIKEYCSDGLGGGGSYPGDTFANGTSTGYGSGNGAPQNFAWRTLDINKTQVADYTGMSITGYTGVGATNELHAMAVKLHEWTGRDVYIFMNHYSGHGLQLNYWPFAMPDDLVATIQDPAGTQPDVTVQKGGMGYNKFVTDFDDAVAKGKIEDALFPDTPTFFFWCSGGSDAGMPGGPSEWLEYYLDLDRELERAGRIKRSTPRIFWDYNENQLDRFNVWGCYRVAAEFLLRPTTILQRTYETWDGTHPLGDRQFHDGTVQAQNLINFSDQKNLDGGAKLKRNKKVITSYGEWLNPNNTAPSTYAAGQFTTNVARDVIRMPYKLFDIPTGGTLQLTHCEQYINSSECIALTEVDSNGVEQGQTVNITDPDTGIVTPTFVPNRAMYFITGPGTWNSSTPADVAGTPDHISFDVNEFTTGVWPPAQFAKLRVEYRVTYPSYGGTNYGYPSPIGIKELPDTSTGGIAQEPASASGEVASGGKHTHTDYHFQKRVVVKDATRVPKFEANFTFGTNGTTNPVIYTPEENGDYERSLHISSVPQYDHNTGLLVPNRQTDSGRYRLEARFDKSGTHDVFNTYFLDPTFLLYQPTVPAGIGGTRRVNGTLTATTTITGRRITPTAPTSSNVIYSVKRDSVIRFFNGTLPYLIMGSSSANYNEINPTNVNWHTQLQTIDNIGFFDPCWAFFCPTMTDETWRWKMVVDFTFDEDL